MNKQQRKRRVLNAASAAYVPRSLVHLSVRVLQFTAQTQTFYAQLIDDASGRTLCSASTLDPEFRSTGKVGSNKEAAEFVGELIGKRAAEKNVTEVTFDRGGRLYHGRVKALADGARNAGLKF